MYRHTDQDTEEPGDTARLDLDVLDSGMLEVRDLTTIGILTDDATSEDRLLDWSQETRVATSLTLTVPEMYVVASSEGTGAGNTVRAVLADQFGAGVGRNKIITFTSADRFEIGNARVRISTFRNTLEVCDTVAYQVTPEGQANTYTLPAP